MWRVSAIVIVMLSANTILHADAFTFTNGDFELGSVLGWTTVGAVGVVDDASSPTFDSSTSPLSGKYSAYASVKPGDASVLSSSSTFLSFLQADSKISEASFTSTVFGTSSTTYAISAMRQTAAHTFGADTTFGIKGSTDSWKVRVFSDMDPVAPGSLGDTMYFAMLVDIDGVIVGDGVAKIYTPTFKTITTTNVSATTPAGEFEHRTLTLGGDVTIDSSVHSGTFYFIVGAARSTSGTGANTTDGAVVFDDFLPTAVPEPGSMSLLAVAALGYVARRRRMA